MFHALIFFDWIYGVSALTNWCITATKSTFQMVRDEWFAYQLEFFDLNSRLT